MADVTVKRLADFESNAGVFYRVRAGLGVTSFGMNVECWPPGSDMYPEHAEPEQEEVYVVLQGWATLAVGGEEHHLEPGIFARVAPGVSRNVIPGDEGVTILCLGGTPGAVYRPPRFTEAGAPWNAEG